MEVPGRPGHRYQILTSTGAAGPASSRLADAMAGVADRVAVVTGAANGLGRGIAEVAGPKGARVVLGDVDAAGLEERPAGSLRGAGPRSPWPAT